MPRPLLSELFAAKQGTEAPFLIPAMGPQPRFLVSGLKGAGDEIYDLIGTEGLLGVRPGQETGEAYAFFDKSATASAAFKRLTGQAPGAEPMPVRGAAGASAGGTGSAWGVPRDAPTTTTGGITGLRILLEQALVGAPAGGQGRAPKALAAPPPPVAAAPAAAAPPPADEEEPAKNKAPKPTPPPREEEVLDNWEDDEDAQDDDEA